MATFYRCDRCKKESSDRNAIKPITLPFMDRYGSFTDEDSGYKKEYCATCIKQVVNFLNSTRMIVGEVPDRLLPTPELAPDDGISL